MDVGSNAFRLVIAEFKSPDKYKVLERVRMPVRLGASVFKDQRIDAPTMDAAGPVFEILGSGPPPPANDSVITFTLDRS